MKHVLLLLAGVVMCASCCVLPHKNPAFANTEWVCVYEMFVADAGTETTTATLTFDAAKGFTLEEKSVMPSYPATYVNPDGTIDRLPGFTREYTRQGTYEVKGDEIVLKQADGTAYTLHLVSDRLESDDLSFQKLVFKPKKGEEQ